MRRKMVFITVLLLGLILCEKTLGETLKLSLVGDCTIGGPAFSRVAEREGLGYFFSGLVEVFSQDDLTLANCEGSFTNRTKDAGHEFNLKGPTSYAEAFKLGSVEAVNIANNHTYDFYRAGRSDTIESLEAQGIGWFGEGDLYITQIKGVTIGMTGYSYPHRYDLTRQERDIKLLREKGCDLVIVSMHWGKETSLDTNKEQRTLGTQLIDLGADIVFGHGPHVLQAIQIYQGKPIFYSLANFSFGANISPKDPDTAAISLEYTVEENELRLSKLTAIPCQMHNNKDFRPYEVTDQGQREKIFEKLVFTKSNMPDSGLPESFLTTGVAEFAQAEQETEPAAVAEGEQENKENEAALIRTALEESAYEYECMVNIHCALRTAPEEAAKRAGGIDKGDRIKVITYGEVWSYCESQGRKGYLKTEWLYHFRSMKPFECKKPGFIAPVGYGRVIEETTIAAEDYTGNTLAVGDLVVLENYGPLLSQAAIHRSIATLNSKIFEFTPFVSWDAARPGQAIAGHTTYYNETMGGRLAANRQYNIKLAIERVNGVVVQPGESFSFNAYCAPYLRSNGYREAPAISSSQDTSYGGGVCQLSTALYNALLATPLYIEEWTVHRDSGVQYAPVDYDCAVGTYSDLRFTNTLSYPVEISVTNQNGVITVLLLAGEGAQPQYLVLD
ncbi:MAG: CapA family protein [Clostridia bacterium]|nr:CapA family protein [Clostridia bacterium]